MYPIYLTNIKVIVLPTTIPRAEKNVNLSLSRISLVSINQIEKVKLTKGKRKPTTACVVIHPFETA